MEAVMDFLYVLPQYLGYFAICLFLPAYHITQVRRGNTDFLMKAYNKAEDKERYSLKRVKILVTVFWLQFSAASLLLRLMTGFMGDEIWMWIAIYGALEIVSCRLIFYRRWGIDHFCRKIGEENL